MDFVESVKKFFGKSAQASKNAAVKAGTAIQNFSDKSVVKIEIKQFENKKKNCYSELGKYVADSFMVQEKKTLKSTDEEVKKILAEINKCDEEIKKRQNALVVVSPKENPVK